MHNFSDSSYTCKKIKIPKWAPLVESESEPEKELSSTSLPPPPVTLPWHTLQLDVPSALPRHSEQIHCLPLWSGNIFDEWEQSIKQIKEREKKNYWKELTGREQPSEPVDQPVPGAMPPEVTKQAIQWRTTLLILVRESVERGNTCHYPLKGHRQGQRVKMDRLSLSCLGYSPHWLAEKRPRELDWSSLVVTLAFIYYYSVCTCVY